jgi:4-hydroxybenzoyl-CoA thioesterase
MGTEPFEHEIRVGWGDCDPARIAYTGRIPDWALSAVDAWWEHVLDGDGWYQMELDRGWGTPFVHMEMDFRHVVTPRHRLRCRVRPVRLGRTSITFRIEGYQDGVLCFEGSFVSVFVVGGSMQTREPPAEVRALVEAMIAMG